MDLKVATDAKMMDGDERIAANEGGDESVVLISGILVNPRSISLPKTADRILNGNQLNSQDSLSEMASPVLEQAQREAFYENGSVQACNNPSVAC
jgi:hypothetical protein